MNAPAGDSFGSLLEVLFFVALGFMVLSHAVRLVSRRGRRDGFAATWHSWSLPEIIAGIVALVVGIALAASPGGL